MTSEVQVYEGPAQVRSDMAAMRDRIATQLPRGMDPDRFLQVAARAIISNPTLMECDRASLMLAIQTAADLGLEPSGLLGSAYIVPFNNRMKVGNVWRTVKVAQLIPGYRGLIDLARRSGEILKVEARTVRQRDEFRIDYGSDQPVHHVPFIPDPSAAPEDRDPGPYIGAYMKALLRDDPVPQVEWMTYDEIALVRKRSKAADGGPWVTDEPEMMRKTVVRRGAKYLPLTTDFRTALELDEVAEKAAVAPTATVKPSQAQQLLLDRAQAAQGATEAPDAATEATEQGNAPQGPATAAVEQPAQDEAPAADAEASPGTAELAPGEVHAYVPNRAQSKAKQRCAQPLNDGTRCGLSREAPVHE